VGDSMNSRRCDQQPQREGHEYQACQGGRTPCRIGDVEAVLKQRLKLETEGDLRAEHLHSQLVQTDLQQRVEIGRHVASIRAREPSSCQERPAGDLRLSGTGPSATAFAPGGTPMNIPRYDYGRVARVAG